MDEIGVETTSNGNEASLSKKEQGKERVGKKRDEVMTAIKGGSDKQGRILFDAYKEKLSDPSALGEVAEAYLAAQNSRNSLDEAGEANKLVASLDALHKQAGLKEGYQLEIKVDTGDLTPEQKQELIRKQLEDDFDSVPDMLAENFVEEYAEARAHFSIEEEDLGEELEEEDLSRAEIRSSAYKLRRVRRRMLHVVDRSLDKIGDGSVGDKVQERFKGEWDYKIEELEESFDELGKTEQAVLIAGSNGEYRKSLLEKQDKKAVKLLNSLDDQTKEDAFSPIAEIDRKIENKRENLLRVINAEPEVVCGIVSDIRELQLERRAQEAQVKVVLAEQRVRESDVGMKKAREELGTKIMSGPRGAKEALGKFYNAGKEWVASRANVLKEEMKRDVAPVFERVAEAAEETDEQAVKVLGALDDRLLKRMRGGINLAKERIKDTSESVRNNRVKTKAEFERKRIQTRKEYLSKRHEVETWVQEQRTRAFDKARKTKWGVFAKLGEAIGGEGAKAKAEERRERIEKITSERFQQRIDRIREKAKENPHLKVFNEGLEKRVKWIGKDEEAVTEREIASPTQEKPSEQDKLTELGDREHLDLLDQKRNEYRDKLKEWDEEKGEEFAGELGSTAADYLNIMIEQDRKMSENSRETLVREGNAEEREKWEKLDKALKELQEKMESSKSFSDTVEIVTTYEKKFVQKLRITFIIKKRRGASK